MSGELIERPEWLVGTPKEEWGVDDLSQYIVPPRLKMVQALSSDELTTSFDIGDCIIMPQKIKICSKSESFDFTPIFFFAEWCIWNPLGTQPVIRDKSLDPGSVIAKKAKTLTEEVIDNLNCTYSEHLNFVVVVHDIPELKNTPIVMTFLRGEHRSGSTLSALIKMRNAPIFACRFTAKSELRTGEKGKWWGITPGNPENTPFVSEEEFNVYKELHASYKEAHENSKLTVDFESEAEIAKDTEF